MAEKKHWIPLEANPDVFLEFATKLGADSSSYAFHDVLGLDEARGGAGELLAMVPQPVVAVLLLFPITKETEVARAEEAARIAAEGQVVALDLVFMKQTIGNACGTIGLLHVLTNSTVALPPRMTPAERGAYLERPPEGAPDIDAIHEQAAQQGATAPPPADADVDLHFAAFVERGGNLYELDGRKASPINHGRTSPATLLANAAAVVRRNFMERAASLNFSMVALGPAEA
eukprot:scaffold4.g4874.t1